MKMIHIDKILSNRNMSVPKNHPVCAPSGYIISSVWACHVLDGEMCQTMTMKQILFMGRI